MDGRDDGRLAAGEAVAACGRLGMGLAEIAVRLGWSRAELRAAGAKWEALRRALERARDAALAWWEGRARVWASDGRANASLWGRAMAGRFGAEGYGPAGRASADSAPQAPPPRERTHRERAKAVLMLLAKARSEADDEPGTAEDVEES